MNEVEECGDGLEVGAGDRERVHPQTDAYANAKAKAGQHTDNATSDNAAIETKEGVFAYKWVDAQS